MSLYISRAVSNFYGTEIEIWASFGPTPANTAMAVGQYYLSSNTSAQLLMAFYHAFMSKIVVSALKSYIIPL